VDRAGRRGRATVARGSGARQRRSQLRCEVRRGAAVTRGRGRVPQVDEKTVLWLSLQDASMPVLHRRRVVRFPRERLLIWLAASGAAGRAAFRAGQQTVRCAAASSGPTPTEDRDGTAADRRGHIPSRSIPAARAHPNTLSLSVGSETNSMTWPGRALVTLEQAALLDRLGLDLPNAAAYRRRPPHRGTALATSLLNARNNGSDRLELRNGLWGTHRPSMHPRCPLREFGADGYWRFRRSA
jgi:hypothetical protein